MPKLPIFVNSYCLKQVSVVKITLKPQGGNIFLRCNKMNDITSGLLSPAQNVEEKTETELFEIGYDIKF